jgi:hypothetical protein
MPEGVNAFQPDARLQTKRVTPELIAYIVEKIAREVSPQRIIMFGSRARAEGDLAVAEREIESDEDIGKVEAAEALGAVRRIRARVIELMKSV